MNIGNQYDAMRAWYHGEQKKKFRDVQDLDKGQRESIVEYIKRIQINKVN